MSAVARRGAARRHQRRQPRTQHRDLRAVRRHHPGHRHPGLAQQPDRGRLLRRRPRVHRPPERHRHRRRLPVGRVVPRHRRRDRASTGTTGSSTRSGSSSPGSSPCCSSPSCCATPAGSPWPTCCRFRLRQRPVRMAAAISTLASSASSTCWRRWPAPVAWWPCCSASRAATGQSVVIAVVGIIMIAYVLVGGMKGTTWVQIIKAVLLIVGAGRHDGLGARACSASASPTLLGAAAAASPEGRGDARPGPAVRHDDDEQDRLHLAGAGPRPRHRRPAARADALLHGAVVQGGPRSRWCGPSGSSASSTCSPWSSATARLRSSGRPAITAAPGRRQLGGATAGVRARRRRCCSGIIAAVAFATILAVVAGLTITASASLRARHLRARSSSGARSTPDDEVRVARITAVVIGVVAIIGGIFANGQNIAFLVALAFAIAASANLPTILYSLFWKRFNTRGALWSIYGGLISVHRADHLQPGRVGQAGRPGHRQERRR